MSKSFDDLLATVKSCSLKKLVVANAADDAVLEAVRAAKDRNIADSILCGDEDKIKAIAAEYKINVDDFEIVDVKDPIEATMTAVKMVHDGEADMYMKGLVDTKTFLKSVLDKEVGLRTEKTLSHVCVFEIKGCDRLLFLSDVAFIPYPDLETKAQIIKNTVEIAHACGVENPKVAPLAAVEVVNPKMPATVDAEALTKMNEEGKITGCIVDGPLSFDLAYDPVAARHKGTEDRKIVGDADVLLFPDIDSGNITYKTLVHCADIKNGNVLTGTKKPVILTSRSDEFETKLNSITLAAIIAEKMN